MNSQALRPGVLIGGYFGTWVRADGAFAAHIEQHRHRGPCPDRSVLLPTPAPGAWR